MLCHFSKKILTIGFFILCSVFCSQQFVSFSYAISDISVTIPANTSISQWTSVFSNCSGDCLNDYSYLIVSGSPYNLSNVAYNIIIFIRWNGSAGHNFSISGNSSYSIYELPFNGSSNNYLSWGGNYSFQNDVTLTLTDSFQSCPDVPVCPEIPESPYDPKLDQITRAIYVCAGTLLVLYFFYCIYRIIIKNSGVK